MKRFAILKTGSATKATQEQRGDFDQLFMDLLARPGEEWETFRVSRDIFPENFHQFNGFLITGGSASAGDDKPWLRKLESLVREIHHTGLPLVGVCLGHQIVAKALGGWVEAREWEIGAVEVTLTENAGRFRAFKNPPAPLHIWQTHRDQVVELPPGALLLAQSAKTSCEAYFVPPSTFGIQGHPEIDAEEVRMVSELIFPSQPEQKEKTLQTLSSEVNVSYWGRVLGSFLKKNPLPKGMEF